MLNDSDDNGYAYFVPGCDNISNVSQESVVCATGFWYLPLNKLKKTTSLLSEI